MAEEAQVVEASNEIKFSEEELKELGELQTSYQEKQAQLGQIAVQKILLGQQVEAIDNRQVEVICVGTNAGPLAVGPTIAAPISPIA